jgi:hypothetical protein
LVGAVGIYYWPDFNIRESIVFALVVGGGYFALPPLGALSLRKIFY